MNKTIEYYLNLPYTRELIPDPAGVWFVRIKELPGCMSQGKTPEEAMRMIDDAMHGWIKVSLEDGDQIPEPRVEEEYSGKFVVRVPKSIHRLLSEAADNESISLNAFCTAALAKEVGMESKPKDDHGRHETVSELEIVFEKLCLAAGRKVPESSNCESAFSDWLGDIFELIMDLYNRGNKKDAIKNLAFLEGLIQTHGNKSPFFISIAKMISHIGDILETSHKEERAGKEVEVYEIKNDIDKVFLTPSWNSMQTNVRNESLLRFVKKEIDMRENDAKDDFDIIYNKYSEMPQREKRNISSYIVSGLQEVDNAHLRKVLSSIKIKESKEDDAKR